MHGQSIADQCRVACSPQQRPYIAAKQLQTPEKNRVTHSPQIRLRTARATTTPHETHPPLDTPQARPRLVELHPTQDNPRYLHMSARLLGTTHRATIPRT